MLKFTLVILFLNPVFAVFGGLNDNFFPVAGGVFTVLAQKMNAPAFQSTAKTQRQNYLSLLNLSDFAALPAEQAGLTADETNVVLEPAPENPAAIQKEEIQTEPASEISRAEISQLMIYPARNFNVLDIEINAESYLLYDAERDLILYSKNIEEKMYIASLTKLMAAMVVLSNAAPEEIAFVSQNAVKTEGEMGNLVVGEKISVRNLLHALLIESSNDAATALAEHIENKSAESEGGRLKFVELMNKKSEVLGLKNTHFTTPSGLNGNYSTALDLIRLAKASFDYPLIWEILKKSSAEVESDDKKIVHHYANSNKLLARFPNILGGKTGYTEEAGECMILVHEIKQGQRNIFVILNAKDRTAEMTKFIQWSLEAFLW